MKALTKNLVLFSIGVTISTILFRYALSTMLQQQHYTLVWIVAMVYATFLFILGWTCGKRDYESLPLYDIGFRFHFATYLICNIVAEVWFLLGFQSDHEKIGIVHFTAIFWGIVVILHFIFYLATRKNAIRGIKKSEIFE